MVNDRAWNVQTAVAAEAKPEGEIHVFEVAEEATVEASGFEESASTVEGGRSTRSKDLPTLQAAISRGLAVMASPGQAGDGIKVPGAVEDSRVIREDLTARERRHLGVSFSGLDEGRDPLGLRKSVGVKESDPFAIRKLRYPPIVGLREAQIGARAHKVHPRPPKSRRLGTVMAVVVHHENAHGRSALTSQSVQTSDQQEPRVPVDDQNPDGGLSGLRRGCWSCDETSLLLVDLDQTDALEGAFALHDGGVGTR